MSPPAPDRLVTYWRIVLGPTGHVLACGLYFDPFKRLEVRLCRDHDDLLCSQIVSTPDRGRALAETWRTDIRASADAT
jgi:hypothetical protein